MDEIDNVEMDVESDMIASDKRRFKLCQMSDLLHTGCSPLSKLKPKKERASASFQSYLLPIGAYDFPNILYYHRTGIFHASEAGLKYFSS